MGKIKEKYGPESVIFVQGTGRDIGGAITLLAYSYGSPNWTQLGLTGQSCYTPRLAGMWLTQGEYSIVDASQFLEERYESPKYEQPELIMVWGQNPVNTCPDGFYGHWIVDLMKRGTKTIVVDPRYNWMASKSDLYLQIRPGTDGALALSMLNVIINEELYDEEFVEEWCYGFEELKERVQKYTPEWAEEKSWIPAEKIEKAARMFANASPAGIQWGLPIDHCPEGVEVSRAINDIWAITGNIDVPGGMLLAKNAYGVHPYPYRQEEIADLYGEEMVETIREKRIGVDEYPLVKNFRAWAVTDPVLEQMNTGDPYPIKGAWIQTNNVLISSANPEKYYEALKDLDFICCVDLFMTPTAMALADLVLPASTYAERNGMRAWWQPLCAINKAVDPEGARSDFEINFELAQV